MEVVSRSLAARLNSKIHEVDGCWIWTGATGCRGYGLIWIAGKRQYAHRVAYQLANGIVIMAADATIDHLCRHRNCVNPAHLQAVSRVENVMRGNAPPAVNARKTHCVRGHAFTPENTQRYSNGRRRRCLACYTLRRWPKQNIG